jgi:hypothetical protein
MPPYPNLFLVGAQKAGTTSLYRYLGQHPDIYTSPEKEPRFFDRLDHDDVTEEAYLALFEGAEDHAVRAEGSTFYLYDPAVPDLIHERVPDARILVSLRDPMQRAYSHYWRQVAAGHEEEPFPDAVRREAQALEASRERRGYLDRSLYAEAVERYRSTFGAGSVRVQLLDDLKRDPRGMLREVFEFLEVDPGPAEEIDLSRRNTFRGTPYGGVVETVRTHPAVKRVARAVLPQGVRDWLGNRVLLSGEEKPPLPGEAKSLLVEVFEPDLRRLEEVLGRDLDPLRASYPDPPDPGAG